MGKLTIQKTIDVELEFAPCLKCGGHDIQFGDCGYSSFNIAFGHCNNKECGHKFSYSCGVFPSKQEIINAWNKVNDIQHIIAEKNATLNALKKEISDLRKLYNKRNKK